MPNAIEWIYVALFAVAWPLYEQFLAWPRFVRGVQQQLQNARAGYYGATMLIEWTLALAGLALWARSGRSWSGIGLTAPTGWRAWGSLALMLLLVAVYARNVAAVVRSARARGSVRAQLKHFDAFIPRTSRELGRFILLSITAGFCEEFLFRGWLLWAVAPFLGWWGAVVASSVAFGFGHAYQGKSGMIRVAAIGLVMSLLYGATRSLMAPIALHALIDMGSGLVTWIALQPEPESRTPEAPRADADATVAVA